LLTRRIFVPQGQPEISGRGASGSEGEIGNAEIKNEI